MRSIMRYLAILLFSTFIIGAPVQSLSASQELELTAAKGEFKFPFFTANTPVWQYNGQIPGPTIRARQGTTFTVNFNNRLDEPSTIHWHGLRIDNSMDSTAGSFLPIGRAGKPKRSSTSRPQICR